MEWQIIIALVIAIPIILFPVAFVWYLNIGGLVTTLREWRNAHFARRRRTTKPVTAAAAAETKEEE